MLCGQLIISSPMLEDGDRSIPIEGMMSRTIEADELLMLVTAHPIRLVSCMFVAYGK
jgi:hypothetical protein